MGSVSWVSQERPSGASRQFCSPRRPLCTLVARLAPGAGSAQAAAPRYRTRQGFKHVPQ